ncbi:uncharacterized protein [Nicotiana tomentosiformis]|uniref:uncharacterized protein n=1 Tax=Nicotiana tomentosiformis TaxID=4098 RepID=UPI00388CA884
MTFCKLVVEVRRVNDRLMTNKLVVGGFTLNMISAYAPQAGLNEEVKRHFWKDLDKMMYGISHTEKLFIGVDFNGHIGATSEGAFDLVIANSSFPNKREHLVTFRSLVAETHIDYLLCRKSDRGLCMDCKVILSENLSPLHRLLVMDLDEEGNEATREVLRVSKGYSGGHKEDWWWNGEVQGKVNQESSVSEASGKCRRGGEEG